MNTTELRRAAASNVRADVAVVVSIAIALAALSIWGGAIAGERAIKLHAAPFFGYWSRNAGWWLLVVIAMAAGIAVYGPRLCRELTWRRLVIASFVATFAFALALALTDGLLGITRGLSSRHDYLVVLDRVASPGDFVRTFLDRIETYPVHVRGHPPGLVPILWWLGRFGLDGITAVSFVTVAAGASSVPAVLIATRAVAGKECARDAAPFLVLAPALVWVATSADAMFLAVGAWSVALVVLAVVHRGRSADTLALAGGAVFGGGLLLSYGLVLVGLVAVGVIAARGRWRVLAVASIGTVTVLVSFRVLFGFSWLDGLAATRAEYARGVASARPFSYFVIANLVVFAVVVGPAAVRAVSLVRGELLVLCAGAFAAVAAADLSGLSKGEVERIWLPFWPWVGIAAAALPKARHRWWLGLQAAVGIGVETFVYTHW